MLITSLFLLARKSEVLVRFCRENTCIGSPTRSCIAWFRLPSRIAIIIDFHLMQRLWRLILVQYRIAAIYVTDQIRYNTANCIGSFSVVVVSVGTSIVQKCTCLRYRRMGSATLKRRTPRGSTKRRHLIVATYCCRISFVSAAGCNSLFRFLQGDVRRCWYQTTGGRTLFSVTVQDWLADQHDLDIPV